jgi:hypothetical protein
MEQKISLYWKCQLIGWSAASLYWALGSVGSPEFDWLLAGLFFVGDLLIYIPITHLYRNISLKLGWQKLSPGRLLIRIIPAIVVLGFLFLMLTWSKNYLIRYTFETGFSESFGHHFKEHWLNIFMAGIRLMAIWILAYYGYHFAQREINAVKESSRLAIIAKEAEFNNLAAQLNPHFFFNSLNSIKALLLENPKAARRAIDLLSDLMRTSLYGKGNRLILLKEELSLVADYLELEKIRFERRLQYSVTINEDLYTVPVLPLCIQILVENAIKHGIAHKKEGGSVAITIDKVSDSLRIRVENPGTIVRGDSAGLGLKNLSERLQLQFGRKASSQIEQKTEDIVLATVHIPLL